MPFPTKNLLLNQTQFDKTVAWLLMPLIFKDSVVTSAATSAKAPPPDV